MSTHPATPPQSGTAATLIERAMGMRHREPDAAAAIVARTAEMAMDEAEQRRARAALGACLTLLPAEVLRGRAMLEEVLRGCVDAGDDALRLEVLNELAGNHNATFDFDPASTYARQAVELARTLGRTDEEARALRALGSACSGTGDFIQALEHLLAALELHERLPAPGPGEPDDVRRWERGTLFGRIAIVYSNLDQFERALSYYEVALESFGDRFPLRAARTLYRMGIAAEGLRDLERAEECYRRSLEINQAHGNAPGRALGLLGLATVQLARGEYTRAGAAVAEALPVLSADPVHTGYHADAVWLMGETYQRRGEHDRALEYFQQALPLFIQTARPAAHLAELHLKFCRAYRGLGDLEKALEHHERYHALTVEHLQAQADTRMSRMMVQFDTERAVKDREISRLRNVELEREIAERRQAEAALQAARAQLEEANRELRAISIRDGLTGVFNRRYLDERLAEAFALARRQSQPLSVMICDVDDFKRINDTFSHAVGDDVLRAIAGILRQNVRQSDIVARFGGEEFVVLFPFATLRQAAAAAEKLCALVREHPWAGIHPSLAVTLSAGVAEAHDHPGHESLLAMADTRLYQAKRSGKNCVVA